MHTLHAMCMCRTVDKSMVHGKTLAVCPGVGLRDYDLLSTVSLSIGIVPRTLWCLHPHPTRRVEKCTHVVHDPNCNMHAGPHRASQCAVHARSHCSVCRHSLHGASSYLTLTPYTSHTRLCHGVLHANTFLRVRCRATGSGLRRCQRFCKCRRAAAQRARCVGAQRFVH